jgi:hypothetical protein
MLKKLNNLIMIPEMMRVENIQRSISRVGNHHHRRRRRRRRRPWLRSFDLFRRRRVVIFS